MGKPGRPEKGHVRLAVHIPPEMKDEMVAEARQRGMTLSTLIAEAWTHRNVGVVVVTRHQIRPGD